MPQCPPEFLRIAFSCVQIDPQSRPSFTELIAQLESLKRRMTIEAVRENKGNKTSNLLSLKSLTFVFLVNLRPSEKARLHFRSHSPLLTATPSPSHAPSTPSVIGKEMSLKDPHYIPSPGPAGSVNPFTALFPAHLDKIIDGGVASGESGRGQLFCSCFESAANPPRAVRKAVSMINRDHDASAFSEEVFRRLLEKESPKN